MARFILSHVDTWKLADAKQDIRGWPVRDREGRRLGLVRSLVGDTGTRRIEAIVLDDGTEIPTREIELGRGVVYVGGARRS
jgi:hypothetical protein